MNRARRILVGTVATLSLLGVGGIAQVSATPDQPTISAGNNRWCC